MRKEKIKAVWMESFGVSQLNIKDIVFDELTRKDEELIQVICATVNPIDLFTVEGKRKVSPMPHIPGVEIFGRVIEGKHKGKYVVVYPRIFCGECEFCLSCREMLCTLELFGVSTNGGFAEFCYAPSRNVLPVPDDISAEIASSLPVGALTAYHAVGQIQTGEKIAVMGATGNTGMFSVQLAKMIGCEVIAISRKKAKWLKEMGADDIMTPEEAFEKLKGKCDAVIDPLGEKTFRISISLLKKGGKFITFGILTGSEVTLDIFELYSKHISILGITGGSREELIKLIKEHKKLKVKVWKEFRIDNIKEAFEEIKNPQREGKILLKFPYSS